MSKFTFTHLGKIITNLSAYKILVLLRESEPQLHFAKEWHKEAESDVGAIHQGSAEEETLLAKLVLSNHHVECQCVQRCVNSLGNGVTNRINPNLWAVLSLGQGVKPLPSEKPQSNGENIIHVLRESLLWLGRQKQNVMFDLLC